MGLKDLQKDTAAYAQAENMYGFNMSKGATIEGKVREAAARIYESGVRVVDGRVMAGYNNVRADFAAAAFTVKQLIQVQTHATAIGSAEMSMMAGIILLRKDFMEDEGNTGLLKQINDAGQKLAVSGVFKNRTPV